MQTQIAVAHANLPLKIIDVDANAPFVKHRFLLVRTDQHISWRGDEIPDNVPALIAILSGRGNP